MKLKAKAIRFIKRTAKRLTESGWEVTARESKNGKIKVIVFAVNVEGIKHIVMCDNAYDAFSYLHKNLLK